MKIHNCHTSNSIFDTNSYYKKDDVDKALEEIYDIADLIKSNLNYFANSEYDRDFDEIMLLCRNKIR